MDDEKYIKELRRRCHVNCEVNLLSVKLSRVLFSLLWLSRLREGTIFIFSISFSLPNYELSLV